MYYQIYEDRTTYLLMIDHTKKIFSLGSFKGKPKKQNKKFKEIDITAYREEISKIGVEYLLVDSNLQLQY